MSQPIRVLHFADVHIGMENYGVTDPETGVSSRALDFLARMDDMIDYAREGDVDLVIFAGDAFRGRSPNPTYQREFAARIRQLSQLAPTVLLVGNHDTPMNAAKASSIEILPDAGCARRVGGGGLMKSAESKPSAARSSSAPRLIRFARVCWRV